MKKDNILKVEFHRSGQNDVLTGVLREGARKLLADAVKVEVEEYIEKHKSFCNSEGYRDIVRNGYMPERDIQTGIGPVPVKAPRVRNRGDDKEIEGFTSKILPPYLRKTRSLEELIPWLYLKGVSTGDFTDALSALLGANAPGLSPSTVSRLKEGWKEDYSNWQKRNLEGKKYAYIWADGIYLNARMEDDKQCILVIIGALENGKKELIAIEGGYRESEQSWKEVLLDIKSRGLKVGPELAIGDGSLGFWKALIQVYGKTKIQRCWVHKTANILNQLPKSMQGKAKANS